MNIRLITTIILSVACTAVAAQNDSSESAKRAEWLAHRHAENAQAKTACAAEGGTFFVEGLAENPVCEHPAGDAGKVCSDSSECSIRCLAPEKALLHDKVMGKCDAWQHTIGRCIGTVEGGNATRALCVD